MALLSGSEDLFDSILMADNNFHMEAFREGFEEGTRQGLLEGQRHGAAHGAKMSTEISFYHGFAITWISLIQNHTDSKARKRMKALDSLLALLHKFPHDDPHYKNLQEDMEKLRAKFRQVCSLLCVPTDFRDYVKGAGGMSF